MGKSLVIVESPAKAKTINKYLGKEFIVKSSVGHIRDLPTSSTSEGNEKVKSAAEVKKMSPEEKAQYKKVKDQQALVSRMGVNPEKGWAAKYQILPGKEKVVKELQALADSADTIYLATDLDREGEAIAWHLQEVIGGDPSRYQRVVFNEITKTAIQDAFSKPSTLDTNMVNAQQARRFLDRVVGFMVSPLLWKKVARGLSAGRVQSVAVRLVVERESEIKAFVPEEFWDVHAELSTPAQEALRMEVVKHLDAAFNPINEQQAMAAVQALSAASYTVLAREDKATQSKPSAPFITSTLQQAASTRLGFGVKKTMMMAQRLYEAGHITYMRTDSTNLSQEAVENLREMIAKEFGDKYLPAEPIRYGSKEGAQEAHEAIRPSNVHVQAATLSDMERDAQRLYELIWRQFVSCQMTPAQYDATKLTVKAGDYELKATGRTLRFDGWTRVQTALKKKNEEDSTLPFVAQGDVLALKELQPKQHFTKPPARYSEASLVKELEKRGIGRPSTYATIISTIQDRGYVKVENRRFYAEKMGEIVSERLVSSFADLMSYDFTASMEQTLDDVARGELDWKKVLDGFYADFTKQLEKAELDPEEGGMRLNQMVMTDIKCPTCGRPMGIRTGTTGVFLGCSGYELPPKERCKTTMNLTPGVEAISENSEDAETDALRAKHRCSICGTAMDSYLIDEKRKLHVCGNNPLCEGYEVEEGQFKIKGYEGPLIECDRCSSNMELKNGRFGKYFGCTNSECKNTRKLLKNGEAAPPKEDPIYLPDLKCTKSDAHFVLRDGAAGIFLAASTFPKSRETRAPLVEELVQYRELLWPKYQYLADAPVTDDEGNKAVVKFSRKTKEQYVATEVDGKATGWSAHYVNGKWVSEATTKKTKKS
ncbi:type I DNA topoisomerase [Shewanella glacialipiscicola]|uniref:type I DNA topoisomerase n=1 Tax=Shewanella glacialipiscicola TaxID=614069 RepID=UPI001BBF6561|nr:type I DNA topoisomerase [Shewanella glacialipiscicola]MCL1084653.1 type I DNA topoisomerase [Shewanella glacialipiscicola]MCU7995173.1 type I DNA topoisomerase [Shewanella glacialipiscicola]MCU8026516.1 type I DNA topoisomerase [Shewanella glacialipiscicola]GIU14956.1 DNA topoisomerase 1 [Shewanella glacialipiscicola]